MHIGILVTNTDDSEFAKQRPLDGEKFVALLQPLRPHWRFTAIQVKNGEFPERLQDFDGFVITGSPASANGDEPWVLKLLDTIREINSRKMPTVGVCFGHQAIARALGGEVGGNTAGWGFGVSPTHFSSQEAWMQPRRTTLNLYAAHIEQVLKPPAGAIVLGGDEFCPVGSYKLGNHFFTTEYHPEISTEFMLDLIDELNAYVGEDVAANAKRQVRDTQVDGEIFANWMVNFFEMKR